MIGGRRTTTLRSSVLRVIVPRLVVFAAVAAMLGVGQAMAVGTSVHTVRLPDSPNDAPPSWSVADVARFPGCRAAAAWPRGIPAARVVVQDQGHTRHHAMSFDAAWARNHNADHTDDVWVLGICGDPGPVP